jgi:hypothetical protein
MPPVEDDVAAAVDAVLASAAAIAPLLPAVDATRLGGVLVVAEALVTFVQAEVQRRGQTPQEVRASIDADTIAAIAAKFGIMP